MDVHINETRCDNVTPGIDRLGLALNFARGFDSLDLSFFDQKVALLVNTVGRIDDPTFLIKTIIAPPKQEIH